MVLISLCASNQDVIGHRVSNRTMIFSPRPPKMAQKILSLQRDKILLGTTLGKASGLTTKSAPHFTMFMHNSPMLGHPAVIEHSPQWFEVLVYVVEYCEEQVW